EGMPASPRAWLIGTARHKALDRIRRERRRADREAEAMREEAPPPPGGGTARTGGELALIFTCCAPALGAAGWGCRRRTAGCGRGCVCRPGGGGRGPPPRSPPRS